MTVYIVKDYSDHIHAVFSTRQKAFNWIVDQNAPPYTFEVLEFMVQ